MADDLFADMVGEVRFEAGVIRIDLVSYSSGERDAEGRAKPVVKGRLIMPPEGFLRTYATLERFIKKLKDAGVLVRRDQQGNGSDTVREAPEA
jgi:hypothetical protein